MGYTPKIQPDPCVPENLKIVFEYTAPCGKYASEKFMLGISMEGSLSYPEHPPHWIHIHPPPQERPDDAREYTDGEIKWIALSRPPGALWDELSEKEMGAYMKFHVPKVFRDLK